ncbi:unnamed protein product [Owenia fusiformis]|uniref:Uncharacterized protein n=1 Tax=Owenia fusiformis TaxID=6347 RepID=A0A8J1TNA3_OWEFU|nr:unnamed protein product [Owenia fusiformis]
MRLLLAFCAILVKHTNDCGAFDIRAPINKGNINKAGINPKSGLSGYADGLETTLPPLPPGFAADDPSANSACVDLMLVFDVSCSITNDDKANAKQFASKLLENLLGLADNINLGIVTYSENRNLVSPLVTLEFTSDIDTLLDNVNMTNLGCKTYTHEVLEALYTEYFTPENGDRVDISNVAAIFTDGRTIQRRFSSATKEAATAAKLAGIEIVVVTVPHRSGEEDLDEFTTLPSSSDLLYNSKKDDDAAIMADGLIARHPCNILPEADDIPCADVVFAVDTSCSVDQGNISESVLVAERIVKSFSPPFFQFGGFTYNNNTVDSFPFTSDNRDAALFLAGLNTAYTACKTRTNRAITYSLDNYFNSPLDDPEKTNFLIIFGDGNESPYNENQLALTKAEAFKNVGGIIIWVVMTSNRKEETRLRGIREQIEPTASTDERDGSKLIFDYDDPEIVYKIADFIGLVATCPRPEL